MYLRHFWLLTVAIITVVILSTIQMHVSAANNTNLNDTQIYTILNLTKNSIQFQSIVEGYNYTFDGIFEYLSSNLQTNSTRGVYTADFTVYNYSRAFPTFEYIRVWIDPTLSKVLHITTGGTSWWGGPAGPAYRDASLMSLCDKSPACYFTGRDIPTVVSSVCSTPSGCDVIGPTGYSIHLSQSTVPEFGSISSVILIVSIAAVIVISIRFR